MAQPKIYWSARNLSGWWNPFGNHHFVLITSAPPILNLSPVRYKNESIMTLGAFMVDGFMVFDANNSSDIQSVKDKIDNPAGWEPSLDMQKHRVAPPYGVDLYFAQGLVVRALRYQQNTKVTPFRYELFGDNCAAWVNTLFKGYGVPDGERRRAGQFWGIDAGERLEIPEALFNERKSYIPPPPEYVPAPGNGERIHIVKSGDWLSKIAQTYYGDMNKWPVIYDRNKDIIGTNPDRIEIGQKLVIP